MRGHEYLVAILSDNGVLRADTLRYADEIRTPETIGLPKHKKAVAAKVTQFSKAIEDLLHDSLDIKELQDEDAAALQAIVHEKEKDRDAVIHRANLEDADADGAEGGAKVIDLMEVLKRSLSKKAVVTTAEAGAPISLADRRAQKQGSAKRKSPKKATKSRGKRAARSS
jgi:DNA end-binding protein Ku